MAIRLIVTMRATPGRGDELARAYEARCAAVKSEPGCEQYEIFRSLVDPDRFVLLERWRDQAALERHAEVTMRGSQLPTGLRAGAGEREDYEYRRTR
jgi:quinol monooxygenase YgiN